MARTSYSQAEERMKKTMSQLHREFQTIRTGRANPALLDRVEVDYYGTLTPLKSLANISTPDGRSLLIQPYDKSCLKEIEQAIHKSDLGLTPQLMVRLFASVYLSLLKRGEKKS